MKIHKIIFLVTLGLLLTASTCLATWTIDNGISTGSGEAITAYEPVASPAAGTYHATQSVILTATDASAICYTIDDSDPDCATATTCSTGTVYDSAISVTLTDTIKAISCYDDNSYVSKSTVATHTYTLTCTTSSVTNGTVGAYSGCAVTCNSGYTLSGSTCVTSGGGGGSSGGSTATVPTTQQTSITTTDGTQVTTSTDTTGGTATATINTVSSPTNSQTVTLDTSTVADASSVSVELSALVMQELVADHGADIDLTVNITSQTASSDQRTSTALGTGTFLVGLDVFNVEILAGDTSITNFDNPLTLSFDVSDIPNPENLTISWFDTTQNKWVDLGGTLYDGVLTITVNHLTDFAVIRTGTTTETTPATTPETSPTATVTTREQQIVNILNESSLIFDSGYDLTNLLSHNGVAENATEQTASMEKYTNTLTADMTDLTTENTYSINNFILYGTQTTRVLGAGERAGVVNSYKSAFDKLPTTADEWADVIKIGNGRWPSEASQTAEDRAKISFNTIYLREADMANPNDNAAVTVMAYGLRPDARNLDSEKVAIKTFKAIFGYNPVEATSWDAVRAIAYSGAVR